MKCNRSPGRSPKYQNRRTVTVQQCRRFGQADRRGVPRRVRKPGRSSKDVVLLNGYHEMASGLHETGLISKRRMLEFDALCHLDVEEIPPQKIKALREKANISQAVFAAVLNISISTIQKWEIGDKKPSGPSLKLLSLIERKGLEAVL